jgi:hypothetical protein
MWGGIKMGKFLHGDVNWVELVLEKDRPKWQVLLLTTLDLWIL